MGFIYFFYNFSSRFEEKCQKFPQSVAFLRKRIQVFLNFDDF